MAIIAALDRLMTGRTTVVTSHRPSLINQADYVYVIENGRISAQGSPEELKQTSKWFERFSRSANGLTDESDVGESGNESDRAAIGLS